MAVYATDPSNIELGYQYDLLAFGPFEDEASLNTEELYKYITFTLSVYDKTWKNTTAIVRDNCTVNRLFAKKVSCGFVVCSIHRFNLAVQDIIEQHRRIVSKVQDLMKRLKYLVPAPKLRRLTPSSAVLRSETHWSSTYNMLKRYFEIFEHVQVGAQSDETIRGLSLSAVEHQHT